MLTFEFLNLPVYFQIVDIMYRPTSSRNLCAGSATMISILVHLIVHVSVYTDIFEYG